MTKLKFSLAIVSLLFAGCGNNKNNDHSHDSEGNHITTESVHEHEDGSIHEDHQDSEHHQEEFKVNSDSSSVKNDSSAVTTEDAHDHSHEGASHQH